ncbi:MFS transporter [Tabrizicola sp.]|uniref:MFS transporter n=1 Tax=Tabrizicola sp. TaxID=2005166 RepID=UPI003F3E4FB8
MLTPVARTVLALGVTQIVGYGTLYYAFAVLAEQLVAEVGVSMPFAFGAFSLALLAGGAVAPLAGRAIDRHGAGPVMALGSVGAALALAALSQSTGAVTLVAALVLVEMVSALVLYDAAFAALAQTAGAAGARRAITLMTLIGGFASTVFWPVTHALGEGLGWRETYLVFAGLHLFVCLPLHLTLRRQLTGDGTTATAPATEALLAPERQGKAMLWLAVGFSLAGVVFSALTVQWVLVLQATGLSATAAVAAGALLGPAQVGVRVIDLLFGVRRHPMTMALLSVGLLVLSLGLLIVMPTGLAGAMIFAVVFGLASGLTSIVRGVAPLALFGAEGYAARLGVLAGLRLASSALAPFALSVALVSLGAGLTIGVAFGVALAAMLALTLVPRR